MSLWIKKKKPKKTTAKNERFFITSIIFVIFNIINNLYINKINKTKIIWPTSTPKLKPNNPEKIFSLLIFEPSKNPPKPNPWISPKIIVIIDSKLFSEFKFLSK